jgi:hypothetical protein
LPADTGTLVLNPIVYAEISVRFARIEDLDAAVPATDFLRQELPYSAGFLAGKAYVRYRRQGGPSVHRSPTSTSVPVRLCAATSCSHATQRGIAATFRS